MPEASIDLDAYFARLGYAGSRAPTLETLHAITARHVAAIPFENLDVLLGRPIRLEPAALQQKLLRQKRGGYCFEQNNLLRLVLDALGYHVTPVGARVRWKIPRDVTPARTHLFLRVAVDGTDWLADVGLGGASLTSAIRLEFDREQTTPHEPRRLIREDGRLFHQLWTCTEWVDVCEFTLDPMHPIDCELANWWTSAHPASHFKNRLIVARGGTDGTRSSIRDREFIRRRGPEILERQELATAEELLEVLGRHFGLHFPPGTRFGRPGAPWPV
ncbi:MAG TPA: arylamine N-acetyltransferase [Lacunisphaera sp.]|nr:arylamine N-acetyltransferase [Lacunisphaera sp.]